jgi:GNAT superfamily N-acetyltransferase
VSSFRVELVPATEADFEAVYAITMATMLAYVEATWGAWSENEHRTRIRESFDPATHRMIHIDGERAGVLAVEEHTDRLQLVKVFLLAPYQGRGIGSTIVRQVMERGRSLGKPVCLRVLRVNPAQRLYRRLGFVVTEETPERLFMRWDADRQS